MYIDKYIHICLCLRSCTCLDSCAHGEMGWGRGVGGGGRERPWRTLPGVKRMTGVLAKSRHAGAEASAAATLSHLLGACHCANLAYQCLAAAGCADVLHMRGFARARSRAASAHRQHRCEECSVEMKALPKNTHTGRGGSEEGRSALTQRERGGCEEEPVHNPGELARFLKTRKNKIRLECIHHFDRSPWGVQQPGGTRWRGEWCGIPCDGIATSSLTGSCASVSARETWAAVTTAGS